MAGQFCISLDFELMWGVHDSRSIASYGDHILGVREAIPQMLQCFEEYGLHATWATVGMLACRTKDEFLSVAPKLRPNYRPGLSSYDYFDEVGMDEQSDPYHFGGSLISQIQQTPGQEIGSHTFAHYYCAEEGASLESFEADVEANRAIFETYGIELKSFVFARNQWVAEYASLLAKHGFTHVRGNPNHWAYAMGSRSPNSKLKRLFRLADCYLSLSGHQTHHVSLTSFGATNVPASQFLYPYQPGKLSRFEPLRIARMKRSMTHAAKMGELYHLWWHPHNFGAHLEENMAVLKELAAHFRMLKDTYGMRAVTMSEAS